MPLRKVWLTQIREYDGVKYWFDSCSYKHGVKYDDMVPIKKKMKTWIIVGKS